MSCAQYTNEYAKSFKKNEHTGSQLNARCIERRAFRSGLRRRGSSGELEAVSMTRARPLFT